VVSEREAELKFQCLDHCLEQLSPANRELILGYYGTTEKKTDQRKNLAGRLGLGANALWIRAHRIRESLRKCASECFQRMQGQGKGDSLKETNEPHAEH